LGEQTGLGNVWDGNGFFILDNPLVSLAELCAGSVQFWTMPIRQSVVDYSNAYDATTCSFDWKFVQSWDKLRICSDTYANYRIAGLALYLKSINRAQCPSEFLKYSEGTVFRVSMFHCYHMADTWVG